MRKFYLSLIIASIGLVGCGTEAAKNKNVADNTNQTVNQNGQNANSNQNENGETAVENEEVPKFEDANEALKQGTEYFDKNKNKMAIDAFKQSVELDPDLAEAHFKLGVAYALEESEEDAKVKPDETEGEDPKKKPKKAKEKKRNSEISFENAVKAYKKFIAKNPKDAEAHFNLGRAFNKLGEKNDEDARKALEQAVKLDDENSLYRTELGAVLIKLAKYAEAIKQLNKAIELQDDNFRAEDLLEEAKNGKKRIDFGANKKT
jgi:tetratricopeptide (TPR) repeat protein